MFARTERLLLRPGWAEDAALLADVMNDRMILRNMPNGPAEMNRAAAETLLGESRYPIVPQFLLFARTGGAPRLVGGCGIVLTERDPVPALEFWVARPFWGLGFATEAGRAVMDIARSSGLEGVRAYAALDNVAAHHVLAKLGFRSDGRPSLRRMPARGQDTACLGFEDMGVTPMRADPSLELYMDRGPVAA